jgi:hypothetical protein
MEQLPWYRQFWPWFLFGLPGLVVIAGLTTWWIAANNADDLVAEEYYKEGLAINRELGKQKRARELGISAEIKYSAGVFQVQLQSAEPPPALQLFLSHPLDAEQDIKLPLVHLQGGLYQGEQVVTLAKRWHWRLEPLGQAREEQWRVDGELSIISPDDI